MNCAEVREHLFAFLDNELEAARSVELQRHLDRCPGCAQEAEIERTIRKRLKALAGPEAAEAEPLDEQRVVHLIRQQTGEEARRPLRRGALRRRVPRWMAAAAILTLVALLGVGLWWGIPTGEPRFAETLIRDLEHLTAEGASPTLDVASSDRSRLEAWVRKSTDREAHLPIEGAGEGIRPLGARMCQLGDRHVPLVLYKVGGDRASLVILPTEEAGLSGMRPAAGNAHLIDRCRGYTVVARSSGALTYVATGRCPEDRLMRLMPPANPATDPAPEPTAEPGSEPVGG